MRFAKAAGVVAALIVVALAPQSASAAGNLAAKPTNLDPLVMDGNLNFSVKEYNLETGKYYKWPVISKGGEEFRVEAPDLWAHAYLYQIRVNSNPEAGNKFIEVKPLGAIVGVEFDDPGEADIYFVPISPGDFQFYAAGFKEKGMVGTMHVK